MKKKKKQQHQKQYWEEYTGSLEIARTGLGFVNVADEEGDILVRPADFNKAFHGDTVKVRVRKQASHGRKREGFITSVVRRRQTDFVGTLRGHAGRWFFIPDTDKPMPHFIVHNIPHHELDEERRVIVRFLQWNDDDRRPTGELVEMMEAGDENDAAMKDIIMEAGFSLHFSDDAMEEAERMTDAITANDLTLRRDMREVLTFTIDPVDARDFDDALSLQYINDGLLEIGVHIADVSHFVHEGTKLDDEAYARATSVYLPDRVNPMLPERISNELCSLRPNEDKFTFSAVFHITAKGVIKKTWIGRTLIHSNRRYTYEQVQEIIQGAADDHRDVIITLNELAQQFRKARFKKGAINFSSQEVRFKLDENAKPVGIVVKESLEAHQLIEEFMLLANRTVAERVSKIDVKGKPLPFPYRVHDEPDTDKLAPFAAFARKFGYTFNMHDGDSIAESLNALLEEAKGTPQQHVLEQLGIRTMAKAIYTTDNIGHYGLGFEHYCHFTSPIRRYPDVMVHRILQQVLDGNLHPDKKLEQKCKHSSERERAAMEAERAANKYKQVEFLSEHVGEEFDAVISGVATFGFWAETVAHKCEGLVSVRDLNDHDDFRLVESDYSLVGLRSGRRFRMGDAVRIKVISANLQKRQLDFEWVRTPDTDMVSDEVVSSRKPVADFKKKKGRTSGAPIPKKKRK